MAGLACGMHWYLHQTVGNLTPQGELPGGMAQRLAR